MKTKVMLGFLSLGLLLACTGPLRADSLWLGNNLDGSLPVLNLDRTGNEIARFDAGTVIGIAANPAAGVLYVNDGYGTISTRQIAGFQQTGSMMGPGVWDLAFDGHNLWGADSFAKTLDQIDTATGGVIASISLSFSPLGLAWDGLGFWVSQVADPIDPNDPLPAIRHYTAAGVLDREFQVAFTAGGLAWDAAAGTLWIGDSGRLHQFNTATGTEVSSLLIADGRFVDGLEIGPDFVAAVPEPSSILLLGAVAAGAALRLRKRMA